MTYFNLPRDARTPETEIDVILANISFLYDCLVPGHEPYSFFNTYYRSLIEDERTSGDDLAKVVYEINPVNDEGIGKVTHSAALFVACGYCCEAKRAYDRGRINEAWTLIIDAKDWLRVPMSLSPAIDRLKLAEHSAALSLIYRENRLIGAAKYSHAEFIDKHYRSKPWKNKEQAVEEINQLLVIHLKNNENVPVRKTKTVDANGKIIEEKQTDFTRLIRNHLPKAKQVKIDRDNWKPPT
ncbi:hypothetical protein CWO84_02815 [Methylomonas sp. Kb3]|uniref:hypothetical protein n=1 Tax=Methylomonas sp. Kb3 TaxID=1611544 RepID=UPI000C33985B|nr:hypothetical protein [Methylomonas sp. Kb3]PKD41973.1 hypothetical protein CWO84_02815 [Methylomonas sp. Kb3]